MSRVGATAPTTLSTVSDILRLLLELQDQPLAVAVRVDAVDPDHRCKMVWARRERVKQSNGVVATSVLPTIR
jgi:hypothetical protein